LTSCQGQPVIDSERPAGWAPVGFKAGSSMVRVWLIATPVWAGFPQKASKFSLTFS
jgi:hypothetical protein